MRLPLIAATALTCLVAVQPRHACAQMESREGITLQNQIYQLQQQLQILQQQVGRGGGAANSPAYVNRSPYPPSPAISNDLLAQLVARVDALEEQVRQLRGRADENRYQTERVAADLGKRLDDLEFRMQNRAPNGAETRPPPPPPRLGQAPAAEEVPSRTTQPPVPPRRTPETAMQEGNAALARHDYAVAEAAAREVLTNYKTSPRAYDAQYLLAQALTGERQFPQAAIAYDDAYNRARKGAHAPDSLLGLANALAAINEKRAACDTLMKLRVEFPQERPDQQDAASGVQQRAGCK
ncbi:MAG: hypothetical protein JO227_15470 [Acetobacteraceae bacterium]|nr:hypothetical protein [Acetobacteraceae bacterium]